MFAAPLSYVRLILFLLRPSQTSTTVSFLSVAPRYAYSLVVFELRRPHIDALEGQLYRTVSRSRSNPELRVGGHQSLLQRTWIPNFVGNTKYIRLQRTRAASSNCGRLAVSPEPELVPIRQETRTTLPKCNNRDASTTFRIGVVFLNGVLPRSHPRLRQMRPFVITDASTRPSTTKTNNVTYIKYRTFKTAPETT